MNERAKPARNGRDAARTARAAAVRAGFTLVELLIVVAIIAVALAAILPAFSRILESNNYASAVNAVSATLARASAAGKDGGVVFLFDPHTERMTLQQVEVWSDDATLYDPAVSGSGSGQFPRRVAAVAFRPTPGAAPVELPRGTGVYGLSFAHDDPDTDPANYSREPWRHWYDGEVIYADTGPSDGRMTLNCWLFPRNHPQFFIENYNPNNATDPNRPQVNLATVPGASPVNRLLFAKSFMVRFNAKGESLGSGALIGGVRDAYLEFPGQPAEDLRLISQTTQPRAERDDLYDPDVYFAGTSSHQAVFNPEVHLRPVDQLAIVDLDRLRAETGVRAPWFVRSSIPPQPAIPTDKQQYRRDPTDQSEIVWKINTWIDENAQVMGFGRYTGRALKP